MEKSSLSTFSIQIHNIKALENTYFYTLVRVGHISNDLKNCCSYTQNQQKQRVIQMFLLYKNQHSPFSYFLTVMYIISVGEEEKVLLF